MWEVTWGYRNFVRGDRGMGRFNAGAGGRKRGRIAGIGQLPKKFWENISEIRWGRFMLCRDRRWIEHRAQTAPRSMLNRAWLRRTNVDIRHKLIS